MGDRLRRDPFLFALVLGALGFTTFSLAVTWWYFRDPLLLFGLAATIVAALALFWWRETKR
jgi:hypothetical protein